MRSDILNENSSYSKTLRKIKHVTEAITLTPEDSGTLFLIDQSSGAYAITLPECLTKDNEMLGWNAEFILHTVASNAVTIVATTDDGDNIHGHGIDGEDGAAQTVTEGTGVDVITIISGATKGDRVSLVSDGDSFYVFSLAADKAHITFS
tara:strand:- start:5137 stop:5586 length:450 start_codon:yes stop_codon:yes gene_type:complete